MQEAVKGYILNLNTPLIPRNEGYLKLPLNRVFSRERVDLRGRVLFYFSANYR